MDRKRFEWLVAKALDALPEEFIARLENVTRGRRGPANPLPIDQSEAQAQSDSVLD